MHSQQRERPGRAFLLRLVVPGAAAAAAAAAVLKFFGGLCAREPLLFTPRKDPAAGRKKTFPAVAQALREYAV